MSDFLDEIKQDAMAPSDLSLQKIAKLAELQLEIEGEYDRKEKELAEIKKQLDKIAIEQLPDAMAEAGLQDFTLMSGQKISVTEDLTCSVPKSRKGEIIAKLREDGQEALIANNISIDLEKGQDNLAGDMMGKAEELGLLAKRSENVNTASLKKHLKEMLDEGEEVDLSFYGAFLVKRAKIKQ